MMRRGSIVVDPALKQTKVNVMAQINSTAIDSPVVRLLSREEAEQEDRRYWHSKTPKERLAAAEQLRQLAYGYDPFTTRIQAIVVRTMLKQS